ncbi:MAG: PHP domain-containing protein, partial [bacterium]|nr:PHP domain-containing protein [bacterium]
MKDTDMQTSKNMSNLEIAKLFRAVAASILIKDKSPNSRFKVIAYENASDAVEHATSEVKDLWDDGNLGTLPGVGKSIAERLDELFRTGKVESFEDLMKDLPAGMFEFLNIVGVGPKSAYKLAKELKINKADGALAKLEKAAVDGRIRDLEGFGKESEQDIIEGIKNIKDKSSRMLLPHAQGIADEIMEYMKQIPEAKRVETLGSLRRQVSTIGDVDIAVASDEQKKVIEHWLKYPKIQEVYDKGELTASVRLPGSIRADLKVQGLNNFGALLQHFTGSKQHNVALRTLAIKHKLSLSEYGVKKDGKWIKTPTEEEFYGLMKMEWVPPEIRENDGEIELALEKKIPRLVELKNMKGDLHLHTNFLQETSHDSGIGSIEEFALKGQKLGYEYIAITEHNPRPALGEKKILDQLKAKKEKVEQLNYSREIAREKRTIKVFNSLEVDILKNGELAIPDKASNYLDFVAVGVHTNFHGSRDEQTKRVLRALENPKVKIFTHPTTRKLGQREGIELDWEKIMEVCLRTNTYLEINSWPERLDLPDTLVRIAVQKGVKLAISTDAHQVPHMELMRYGVSVAKRGWSEAK